MGEVGDDVMEEVVGEGFKGWRSFGGCAGGDMVGWLWGMWGGSVVGHKSAVRGGFDVVRREVVMEEGLEGRGRLRLLGKVNLNSCKRAAGSARCH